MTIRPAVLSDLDRILSIVADARAFLAAQGLDQWQGSYPDRAVFVQDITEGVCYLCCDEQQIAQAVFVLRTDHEAAYDLVYEGAWQTAAVRYMVLHRFAVASALRGSGIAAACLDFATAHTRRCGLLCLRTDTHEGNLPMRRLLERCGFIYCGIVYYDESVEGGCKRVAYELTP